MITSLKDSTKKPVKLHKKVRRTDLENKLRNRLSNEPGAKLLLQEMYVNCNLVMKNSKRIHPTIH